MATKAKRHTHKYYKVDAGTGTKVWACALGDCNHFMPPHYARLVNGKNSRCWKCNEEFVLDLLMTNANQDKPLCMDCTLMTNFGKDHRRENLENKIEDFQPTHTQSSQPTQNEEFPICSECQIAPPMKNGTMCYRCFVKMNP